MKGSGRRVNYVYNIVAMILAITYCNVNLVASTSETNISMVIAIMENLPIRFDGFYAFSPYGTMNYGHEHLLYCSLPFLSYVDSCEPYRKQQRQVLLHIDMCLLKTRYYGRLGKKFLCEKNT